MHLSLHLHKGSLDEIYGRTEIHAKKNLLLSDKTQIGQ